MDFDGDILEKIALLAICLDIAFETSEGKQLQYGLRVWAIMRHTCMTWCVCMPKKQWDHLLKVDAAIQESCTQHRNTKLATELSRDSSRTPERLLESVAGEQELFERGIRDEFRQHAVKELEGCGHHVYVCGPVGAWGPDDLELPTLMFKLLCKIPEYHSVVTKVVVDHVAKTKNKDDIPVGIWQLPGRAACVLLVLRGEHMCILSRVSPSPREVAQLRQLQPANGRHRCATDYYPVILTSKNPEILQKPPTAFTAGYSEYINTIGCNAPLRPITDVYHEEEHIACATRVAWQACAHSHFERFCVNQKHALLREDYLAIRSAVLEAGGTMPPRLASIDRKVVKCFKCRDDDGNCCPTKARDLSLVECATKIGAILELMHSPNDHKRARANGADKDWHESYATQVETLRQQQRQIVIAFEKASKELLVKWLWETGHKEGKQAARPANDSAPKKYNPPSFRSAKFFRMSPPELLTARAALATLQKMNVREVPVYLKLSTDEQRTLLSHAVYTCYSINHDNVEVDKGLLHFWLHTKLMVTSDGLSFVVPGVGLLTSLNCATDLKSIGALSVASLPVVQAAISTLHARPLAVILDAENFRGPSHVAKSGMACIRSVLTGLPIRPNGKLRMTHNSAQKMAATQGMDVHTFTHNNMSAGAEAHIQVTTDTNPFGDSPAAAAACDKDSQHVQ